MDERELREILKADEAPAPDENARKRAMNLAMAAFDETQREKAKKPRQGFGFLGRLTGRSSSEKGKRPMNSKILYGGMATAMTVVLAVVTYRTMPIVEQGQLTAATSGPVAVDELKQRPTNEVDKDARAKAKKTTEAEQAAAPPPAQRRAERDDSALAARPAPPAGGSASTPSATPFAPQRGDAGKLQKAPATSGAAEPKAEREIYERLSRQSAATPPAGLVAPQALSSLKSAMPADQPPPAQYQDVGRDQFASVDENPVKAVSQEPVSTFSIDVDTASYAFVRRMLMRGVLPQKDAVRVEEMVNYFHYDYPLPATRETPFRPTVTVMDSPWKKGNKLIEIGIKGYDLAPAEKPRSNLVFLLDVSGSMNAPDKLPLMINSMKLLLDTLKPDDTVAIVTYAGRAGTVLEPTAVSEKQKILSALERLSAGGSTAGAAGIRQAYALAEGSFDKKAVNRVILATDGDFNVGITNREELKGFIERKRASGVFLSILGFGQGNLNDRLMQDLAQNGNGVAAHIDTLNEARKVLVDEASGMLFPIAKDVKIQVEFNPKTVAEYRLIGYETRALKREDFNNDKVDAGDIGAGHTVTAIYEITPVNGGDPLIGDSRYKDSTLRAVQPIMPEHSDEYAFLKIRYKLPAEDTSKLITTPIKATDETDGCRHAGPRGAMGRRGRRLRTDPQGRQIYRQLYL